MSPKEPEPIFLINLYLPPTMNSFFAIDIANDAMSLLSSVCLLSHLHSVWLFPYAGTSTRRESRTCPPSLSLPAPSLARSTVPQYLAPSLRLSLPRWPAFLCRPREGRAESRVSADRGVVGLAGPISASQSRRACGRRNVSRASCSLATRQAPSTARRHFPSRCGHEEQRLTISRKRCVTDGADDAGGWGGGAAALPLNGVTPAARYRPYVRAATICARDRR